MKYPILIITLLVSFNVHSQVTDELRDRNKNQSYNVQQALAQKYSYEQQQIMNQWLYHHKEARRLQKEYQEAAHLFLLSTEPTEDWTDD